MQKSRLSKKKVTGGCCGIIAAIVFIALIASVAGHGITLNATPAPVLAVASPTQVVTAQPTASATATPKTTPVVKTPPTSTQIAASSGAPVLGAALGDFVGRFGQPNQFSIPQSAIYFFSIYGKNKDDITIMLIDGTHVDAITQAAPTDQGWTLSDAKFTCRAFLPSDAQYVRTMTLLDASGTPTEQDVYVSPLLAKLFPASDFTDEKGNQTTPGTIGMTYIAVSNTSSRISECGPQVGLQLA